MITCGLCLNGIFYSRRGRPRWQTITQTHRTGPEKNLPDYCFSRDNAKKNFLSGTRWWPNRCTVHPPSLRHTAASRETREKFLRERKKFSVWPAHFFLQSQIWRPADTWMKRPASHKLLFLDVCFKSLLDGVADRTFFFINTSESVQNIWISRSSLQREISLIISC